MENKLSLIVVVANSGSSEDIMSLVKDEGACGGTIINGFGSVSHDAQIVYGIKVNPEKEVILIIVDTKIKNNLMKVIYHSFGNNPHVQAIAFSLPIEEATQNLINQYHNNQDKTKKE